MTDGLVGYCCCLCCRCLVYSSLASAQLTARCSVSLEVRRINGLSLGPSSSPAPYSPLLVTITTRCLRNAPFIFTARRVCITRTMPLQDVRPSVCHTPILTSHAGILSKRLYISSKVSPSGSPTILVFQHQTGWQYSHGDPPNGGVECKGDMKISRFSTNISLYLANDAR